MAEPEHISGPLGDYMADLVQRATEAGHPPPPDLAMPTRPIRYCDRCGEYVDERWVGAPIHGAHGRAVKRLVHVSETGAVIDRSHRAIEAGGQP